MKSAWAFGITVLLLLTTTPPISARFQPTVERDTVVIGMPADGDALNHPMFSNSASSELLFGVLFTRDVQRDVNWKPFPQGVEYLPSIAGGTWSVAGERMSLTWRIKPRTWHDGHPVTCADYVFSHQVARDRNAFVVQRGEITRRIENVSCPKGAGAREVVVNWNARFPHANLGVTPFGPLARHVFALDYRANPSRLRDLMFSNPKTAIGDGAYRVVEWKSQMITAEAVGHHPVFATPRIKRITWRLRATSSDLVRALLAGTIDVISTAGISFDEALELARLGKGRITVHFSPSLAWEHADFNLDNPFLADVRVRRAIAHGVNRVQIVQQLFAGKQPVSHTYLPPRHPGYTAEVPRYPFDPACARSLLHEAGFDPDRDGIMRNDEGQRLALELITTSGNLVRERVATIMQEQLRLLGIDLTIALVDTRILFDDIIQKRKFRGLAMYAWLFGPDADCKIYFTSEWIPTEAKRWFGANYPGYRNPEMDRVCQAATVELDEHARVRLLRESARIFARDLPALPLYYRVSIAAAKSGLRNFSNPGLWDSAETWNAHQWYWE